jgi:site-specific recombinase XerD
MRAVNTARAYANALRVFSDFLKYDQNIELTAPLSTLTIRQFRAFPSWLLKQNYAKKTNGVYISAVGRFVDYLVNEDLFDMTWAEATKLQKANSRVRGKQEDLLPRFPKEGEAEAIIKAAEEMPEPSPRGERNLAILLCLYSSGCRNDELVKLKINDIELSERSTIALGKGSKSRRIFFSSEACEALEHYWAVRKVASPKEPAFIRHDKGGRRRIQGITTATVRNVVKEYVKLAGVNPDFSPHWLRHNFAITVLRQTHDLALIQDLLGHSRPDATRVYAKIYPDELQRAHQKIFD